VKEIRPLAIHTATLLAGAFWPRRLIWWVTGNFEYCEKMKYEIVNLLVMVDHGDNFTTQFLVEPHCGGPDESHAE
jgi:hypothetical protein